MKRRALTRILQVIPLFVGLLALGPLQGQELRHEVGLRLRSLESTWNDASAEAKQRALPLVERAVRSFFGFDLAGVAAGLDQARMRLVGEAGPARWFDSLSVQPVPRVVPGDRPLSLRISRVYTTSDPWPEAARLSVEAADGSGARASFLTPVSVPLEPVTLALPWTLAAGDWTLTVQVFTGDELRRTWVDRISVQTAVDERIDALERRLEERPRPEVVTDSSAHRAATYVATARVILARCRQVVAGSVPELPFPVEADLRRAAELIARLESIESAPLTAEPVAAGDQWWVVAHGGKQATVRMWVPEPALGVNGVTLATRPMVVAVHGLGGTENLFFESYGAGRVVDLCRQRGWTLVAPKQPLFGGMGLDALVHALTELVRFDPRQVFIVGHSKGAGESLAAVQRSLSCFRAAALLGGGGRVASDAELQGFPFWIAAGERDFGLSMARRTHDALLARGARSQWTVIPNTEHLTVVADALPSVFRFFEAHVTDAPSSAEK
ncbi:MAG: hypothetical protein AB7O52_20060 [Planctomycetota bacterium]